MVFLVVMVQEKAMHLLYIRIMKTYHLPVVVETDEDGIFIVSCPVFKGCHSYGNTIDEALDNLKEVVTMCIDEQPAQEHNKFIGVREMEFKMPVSA